MTGAGQTSERVVRAEMRRLRRRARRSTTLSRRPGRVALGRHQGGGGCPPIGRLADAVSVAQIAGNRWTPR